MIALVFFCVGLPAPASGGPPALRRRMPHGVSVAVGGLARAVAQVAG